MMSKSFEEFFSELNSMNIQDHDLYLEEALKNLKKCTAPFEVRDIVEQQQAEIERLKSVQLVQANRIAELRGTKFEQINVIQNLKQQLITSKSEAVKEFAERLKKVWFDNGYESPDVDFEDFVDNLVKEMTGDTE